MNPGFIFTLASSLNWATAIILTRLILSQGENPYNLTFWTMLLALPYWLWIAFKEKKNIKKLKSKDIAILCGMAFISSVAVSFLEVFALKYSPAINYSFLFRTVIAFTILFAYIFLHEPITKKKIILLLLIMAGSFFLTTKGQGLVLTPGDVFTLLEAAVVAFGTNILSKLATNRMSADTSALGRYILALPVVLLIAGYSAPIVAPTNWFIVIIITILNMVFLQTMFRAFTYVSSTYFTMIMSFTPVFVTVFAILTLGESLSLPQVVGGTLIVLAGVFVEKLKI